MTNSLFSLDGKLAIVTGATGQLGSKFCEALDQSGAKVIGIDLKESKDFPYPVYACNISDEDNVSAVFEEINKDHGAPSILINNAGVSTFENFEDRKAESFDWVMDTNLKGTFLCLQKFVALADKNKIKNASIVNIASMYGIISPDFRIYTDCDRKNSEVYGATKAGVIQMTKYFAVHLADRNIRVNAVSPGGILNPESPQGEDFQSHYAFRCPMKRMALAEEMVGAVVYLSSPAASYTNGLNMVIDGGMSCW